MGGGPGQGGRLVEDMSDSEATVMDMKKASGGVSDGRCLGVVEVLVGIGDRGSFMVLVGWVLEAWMVELEQRGVERY